MHRSGRTAALIATALLSTASLTACSALSGVEDTAWPDHRSMTASPNGDHVPSLVNDDATDIRLRERTYGAGPAMIAWRSDAGLTRDDCEAGPLTAEEGLSAPWWPESVPSEGTSCGWWQVFEQDGTYYAWDHRGD